jgi:hypothetical protein
MNEFIMNGVHHPLHDFGQFLPVRRLDVERERHPLEHKPAYLKGKNPFRITEYAVQEDFRPRQLEQGLADTHRRADQIPHVFP